VDASPLGVEFGLHVATIRYGFSYKGAKAQVGMVICVTLPKSHPQTTMGVRNTLKTQFATNIYVLPPLVDGRERATSRNFYVAEVRHGGPRLPTCLDTLSTRTFYIQYPCVAQRPAELGLFSCTLHSTPTSYKSIPHRTWISLM
jgi:hypothetical protein